MKKELLYLLTICLIFSSCKEEKITTQPLGVAPIFQDNAILQRNKPNKIWGKGTSKEKVYLHWDDKTYQTKVDADGFWMIETDTLKAGGPFRMSISSDKDTILLNNIWVGDVWLCSGQSNMEFSVGNFPWAEAEKQMATNQQIHFYTLPNSIDLIPSNEIPVSEWKTATGDNLLGLSATAYFFAKNIQPEIGVPVGLIVSDWSGTSIEPWMSKESLRAFPQFSGIVAELDSNNESIATIEKNFKEYRAKEWDSLYYLKGKGMEEKWYLPATDFSAWTPIQFPNYWEDANVGLDQFDGAVWFQTTFDLPENFSDSLFHIYLAYIKDYNIAWVNGHQIGETYGDKNWSDYYAPARYLQPKGNVLVVRAFNVEGKGGFNYHPFWETEILKGKWVCKADEAIDPATFPKPKIVNVSPFSNPTIIYNAMIYPLQNYALTGFIWYQGESNAGRGYEYRQLFPAMIKDWRKNFAQGDLPFYFVQLANLENPPLQPANSDWAELRESQTLALDVPNTGMAVTIDIGEANDIHPKNKQEVGRRLSILALEKTYGKAVQSESPAFQSVEFKEGKAFVSIRSASPLQKINPATPVGGFAIAGTDSIFHWGTVEKMGESLIVVSSPQVKQPVAIRYAWSKNPGELNITNQQSLPLAPFRSDHWKGITDDRLFDINIAYF